MRTIIVELSKLCWNRNTRGINNAKQMILAKGLHNILDNYEAVKCNAIQLHGQQNLVADNEPNG